MRKGILVLIVMLATALSAGAESRNHGITESRNSGITELRNYGATESGDCGITAEKGDSVTQGKKSVVEVFCGADLSYSDTNFMRLYNALINLTPGVRWNMGKGWMTTAQLSYAVLNLGYSSSYKYPRLGMAAVSKELSLKKDNHLKFTAGLFTRDRYGVDVRWMMPVCSWFMLQARVGVTNMWWLSVKEHAFETKGWTPTGTIGANFWIDKWATEFRLSGGRYVNEDFGMEGEAYCHFNHCSVGAFAQYHELYHHTTLKSYTNRFSGGFRVVMMIPPYKYKKYRKVRVRPASNFRLTYNAQSDGHSMKKYHTDPEENEREYQMDVKWGTGLYR